jgi:hypothetical protein
MPIIKRELARYVNTLDFSQPMPARRAIQIRGKTLPIPKAAIMPIPENLPTSAFQVSNPTRATPTRRV